jgi:hypothetical protein
VLDAVRPFIRACAVLATTLAALPITSAGAANQPTPGDASGVAQYVEQLPTSSGPVAARRSTDQAQKLPIRIRQSLRAVGGDDAALLGKLAGSGLSGAESKASAPATAVEGGSGSMLWVALMLGVVTLGCGGAVISRRRQHGSHISSPG